MRTIISGVADPKISAAHHQDDKHMESCGCIENNCQFHCMSEKSRTPIFR